jgi:hypothetical protein
MKQWLAYIGIVGAAFAGGFQIGTERTTLRLEQAAFRAERNTNATTDSLRVALSSAQRKTDTVWRTVTAYRRQVDTAWAQVPESIFVAMPELGDARSACLALSTACEEARLAHEQERAIWLRKAEQDSLQGTRLRQAWAHASEQAQAERNKAWQRRAEGAVGTAVLGLVLSRITNN